MLVPCVERSNDWFGMDAGKIRLSEDFDELSEDILENMSDPKIFPREWDEER
jgi:hypothetical protein